jgi:hypothetical protein
MISTEWAAPNVLIDGFNPADVEAGENYPQAGRSLGPASSVPHSQTPLPNPTPNLQPFFLLPTLGVMV